MDRSRLVPSWLRRRDALTVPRGVVAAITCAYGAVVLDHVLLPFPILVGAQRHGLPPWRVFVHLTPLVDVVQDPSGLLLNILLFAPLGILLPLLVRRPSGRRVLLTGAAISVGIELVQFITDVTVSTGRIADVDDVIANTAGVAVGYVVYRAAARAASAARATVRGANRGAGKAPGPERQEPSRPAAVQRTPA